MNKNKPVKVAFLASIYRHLEGFHLPYIKLLQAKGCEVHAYAKDDNGKIGVAGTGVICHDTPFRRSPYHPENIKALKYLIRSFKEENFQMVHLHTPVASILGRIAARVAGGTIVIYTAHGFHFFKGAPFHYWLLYYPVEKYLARFTDYLVTINQEDYLRAQHFAVKKRVVYVEGGVGLQLDRFNNVDEAAAKKRIRAQLGLNETDFITLCVAEIRPNKNQLQLIAAVKRLVENGRPVQCLLVGTGPDEGKLRDYVKLHSLESRIHFLGYRRDIPELMGGADVVVNLSRREGLPRVLIEAAAAGKPVVATDVRGNRDLVMDGSTGFVIPVGSVDATVEALIKIIDEPALCKRMGSQNKERSKCFAIEKALLDMDKIYDPVIEGARVGDLGLCRSAAIG